ncbi:TetR family transcriptional regulator [Nonomuraea sp. WAC 01424]|uniref:TetR/AcrR family transcriptional regulator n=1 Tax=Nonomuraea sp. WAC 01424 TaxID=2203200 RepID=UPI000F7A1094|nr:TetR family transcriptional regulator C-terminal domain-containing protein [Nonomuraea sp. WAC 01424]RSN04356.1 TetR family transcriptional regulator [Nonomuraea sp. WAC 01424]
MTTDFSRLRREDLLKTACEVIAEQGFGHTRTLDISRAAGVSQALLFYHFDTKDRLFAQAFSHAARLHLESLAYIEDSAASPLERLRALLRRCSPATPSDEWRLWIDAWAEAMRSSELEEISRRIDARGRSLLRSIIEDGLRMGAFACGDPEDAVWRIFALIDGLALQTHVHPKVLSRRRAATLLRTAVAAELGVAAENL